MGIEQIKITTADDFEPSERLRAALDRLAEVAAGDTDDAEVAGFDMSLGIGLERSTMSGGDPFWSNGCWRYSTTKGQCGWYKHDDVSCVGYTWTPERPDGY